MAEFSGNLSSELQNNINKPLIMDDFLRTPPTGFVESSTSVDHLNSLLAVVEGSTNRTNEMVSNPLLRETNKRIVYVTNELRHEYLNNDQGDPSSSSQVTQPATQLEDPQQAIKAEIAKSESSLEETIRQAERKAEHDLLRPRISSVFPLVNFSSTGLRSN
ncbi:unnamed protein product [Protopolystoma xenopodis]|uniref:Uncharacterized protein n=1 Tax=Protopolystoma xenopodis TaxID=117903 RepID=A0A3S5AV31_9PLAT|nr:unnamed protein product [Protopolystoma xenopodis]